MTGNRSSGYPLTPEACRSPEYQAMCEARTKLTGFVREYGGLLAEGSASGALVHEEFALSLNLFFVTAKWAAVACPSLEDLTEEEGGTAGVITQFCKLRDLGGS